jgi:hypothetical protein
MKVFVAGWWSPVTRHGTLLETSLSSSLKFYTYYLLLSAIQLFEDYCTAVLGTRYDP